MTRPTPRTSALSGMTAAQPAQTPVPHRPANNEAAPVRKSTSKVTVTIDSEILDRARSAFLADGPQRGIRSLSIWLAEAIEAKTITAENHHNGGNQFPPTPTGIIPTGRRS